VVCATRVFVAFVVIYYRRLLVPHLINKSISFMFTLRENSCSILILIYVLML